MFNTISLEMHLLNLIKNVKAQNATINVYN